MNLHSYVPKMRLIQLIFFSLIWSKECEKGQTQCSESMMLICTDEGYWAKTECPTGSACKKDDDIIGCQNTEESEDDISIDNPIEPKKDKSKTVTVTMKKSAHKSQSKEKYKTVTVTKNPKEIDLEVDENSMNNGKMVTYSILLQNPSTQGQGGSAAQMVAPSISIPSSNPPSVPAYSESSPSSGSPVGSAGSPATSPGSPTSPSSSPGSPSPASSAGSPTPPVSSPSADSSANPMTESTPSSTADSALNQSSGSDSSSANSSSGGQESTSTNNTQSGSQPSSNMGNQQSTPQSSSNSNNSQSSGNQASNQSSNQSNSNQASNNSSGGQMITEQKLTKALKENNMTPNNSYLQVVVKQTNSHFKDKEMAAMFLAQLAHESGGFAHIEEIACKSGGGCAGQYGTGAPGKSYHGRGFIQLSWPDNYKNASKDLGMGDKLYQTPEVVASDVDIGMKVSIWYWDKRVATFPGVKEKKQFGLTTKAINGELECKNNANIDKSKRRYALYKSIAKEMGITNLASESGCYTM